MVEKELGIKKEYEGSMDSKYYFSASKIGATASTQVANQIGELNSRLNQGLKAVELGTMNQRLLDQVPKEHFTEIKRMADLTGAEPSLHAPIQDLDLAGFTQQGWDSNQRKRSVEQLKGVVEKAHLMDPDGNVPITIHAGTFPSQKWEKKGLMDEEGKPAPDTRSEMMIINEQTGEIRPTKYRERMRIGKEAPEAWTPQRQMDNTNRTSWDQEKFQILQWKKIMNENDDRTMKNLVQENYPRLIEKAKRGEPLGTGENQKLAQLESVKNENTAFKSETYQNIRSAVEDMYERFKKYPYEKGNRAEQHKFYEEQIYPKFKKDLDKGEAKIEKIESKYHEVTKEINDAQKAKNRGKVSELKQEREKIVDKLNQNIYEQTEMAAKAVEEMPAPKTWQSVDEFAKKETSTSVAEAALDSYKKYGKNSPMLLLENVYPEFSLSRADDLKETIDKSQEKFVKKLREEKNISKTEAKEIAKKIIGVTWDVGHIYMLRKSGYSDEDIRKEAATIAPHVKHIHLTDNFGFEDSHLPPGLGDVNIKDQLRAIEKAQGEKAFGEHRGIVEAGEFVANYKEVPHLYALAHLGSPLYSEDAAPYWHEAWDVHGSYAGGYGEMMPQKYFDLYGAPGFSQLPAALGGGGQGGGERGRFAAGAGMPQEDEE